MNEINELLKELLAIQTLGNSKTEKVKAVKRFAEGVFDAARDTFPMDSKLLYNDFDDYHKNN